MSKHMAIDQYGNIFHGLGPHPRKALLERLYHRHADKMYVDDAEGKPCHIGYIIGGHWLTVYRVEPFKGVNHE